MDGRDSGLATALQWLVFRVINKLVHIRFCTSFDKPTMMGSVLKNHVYCKNEHNEFSFQLLLGSQGVVAKVDLEFLN